MQIRILVQEPEIGKASLVFLDDQGRGTMPAKIQYLQTFLRDDGMDIHTDSRWVDVPIVFEKDLEGV